MSGVTVIELWPHEYTCVICDQRTTNNGGLAVYESEIVPDDYKGEWGGAPACRRCYLIARGLQSETPQRFIPFREVLEQTQGGVR